MKIIGFYGIHWKRRILLQQIQNFVWKFSVDTKLLNEHFPGSRFVVNCDWTWSKWLVFPYRSFIWFELSAWFLMIGRSVFALCDTKRMANILLTNLYYGGYDYYFSIDWY